MKFLYRILLLLTLLQIGFNSIANVVQDKKVLSFRHFIGKNASIELNNQYGDIQIETWEKDSVFVLATITASSDKEEEIADLLESITVSSNGNDFNFLVNTSWSETSGFFRRGTMEIKRLLNSNSKLSVDYKVYLPATSNLSIANRFGDIYLPDYFGPLRVDLSHGDLRARNISIGRSITVRYGKVFIKNLDKGIVNVEYGSLILEKAKVITLKSKSSTIEFIEVNNLNLKSKNDDIRIEMIKRLKGESTFSNLLVRNLGETAIIKINYGGLILKNIKFDFNVIDITGNSTDIDLEFGVNSNFSFEIETTNEKGTVFPINTDYEIKELEKNQKEYSGYIGNKNTSRNIRVFQKNGYFTLSVKN